jgi:ankyrin repeat protein
MGDTALLLAVAMGQESAVAFLLDGGANPDIQNATGRAALHEAAFLNTPDIWNRLVQAGARTDIVSVDRHTPLTLKDSLAFGASMLAYSQEKAQQAMGQRSGARDNSRGR